MVNTPLRDILQRVTKALPAAGASASSTALDLEQTIGGIGAADQVLLEIDLPATPNLADAKTIILTLEDSADNSSFAVVKGIETVKTLTGASSAGAAAYNVLLRLPPHTRRYVRVTAAVLAAGGTNTAVSFAVALLR